MIDMTEGRPLKLLWAFSAPLMLSSLFQQLYTLADSMIVGRLLGAEAFAAIGAAGYLYGFPSSMLGGMCQGFGVLLAQKCGAKDGVGYRRALAAGITLSCIAAALLTAGGILFLHPLLGLMNTPEAMMGHSVAYLRVMLAGLIFSALFFIMAAALRSAGDSRTPFYSGVIANALNIALDYVMIRWMGMGVIACAMSTVIAQGASALICLRGLLKAKDMLPRHEDWRMRRNDVRQLLYLGVPPLSSHGVNAVGEMVVQTVMNGMGVAFVAGMMAARRYYSLLSVASYGMEGAVGTYVGQNVGAKRRDRVMQGVRTGAVSGGACALGIAAAACVVARSLILLFLPDATAETLRIGMTVLRIDALGMAALNMLVVYRSAIQGMGNSIIPMLSGFMEMGVRVACALILPLFFGAAGLYCIEAINWCVTGGMLALAYRHVSKKWQNF